MFPARSGSAAVFGMMVLAALPPGTQAAGEPGSPKAARGSAEGPAAAVDRHGDPLPALALIRLGTIRWWKWSRPGPLGYASSTNRG
jgi:hypothetical protein